MNESYEVAANDEGDLRPLIHEIRGVQVIFDRDLALLYGVPTKRLNEQVRRNRERFPADFMFQLTAEECSRSQIATMKTGRGSNVKYCPYVFTENGVAMLSSVLRSSTAIEANIRIMRAFVAMRRTLQSIHPILARIEEAERRQIVDQARNEERFEKIFDAMQENAFPPQKLFFDGQFYDAFLWVKDLIINAKSELIVIDPYFDASALPLFAEKRKAVKLMVVRSSRGKRLLPDVDIQKFNSQYFGTLEVKESERFHDRFIIVDRKKLIHIGASLNYLGKKCFACSTFDPASIPEILEKL